MVGSNNLYACCVCTVDDLLYNVISGKDLNIHQIHISGLCCFDVQLRIGCRLNRFFTALFGGTECHQKRNIAECFAEVF
ncbi:unknown [Blautia sp. CAG:37]|nr:unknown [Blautia sp. CAG:37]